MRRNPSAYYYQEKDKEKEVVKLLYTSLAVFAWVVAMGLYTSTIVEGIVNKDDNAPLPHLWKFITLLLTISQVIAGAYWWIKAVRLP